MTAKKRRQVPNPAVTETSKNKRTREKPVKDISLDPFIDYLLCPVPSYVMQQEEQERIEKEEERRLPETAIKIIEFVTRQNILEEASLSYLKFILKKPQDGCILTGCDSPEFASVTSSVNILRSEWKIVNDGALVAKENHLYIRIYEEVNKRLGFLQNLADASVDEPKIVTLLYMYIDSYMALAIELENNSETRTFSYQRLLELCPSIDSAFTLANMPDMKVLLPLAFKYNDKQTSNRRMIKQAFKYTSEYNISVFSNLIHVLYKSIPQRCFNRQQHALLLKACKFSPNLIDFVGKLVIASLLGLYENSQERASIPVRIELYRYLLCGVSRESLLSQFNQDNTFVLMFIVREYFHYLVENTSGLLILAKDLFEWDAFTDIKNKACDQFRKTVNSIGAPKGDRNKWLFEIFNGISRMESDVMMPDFTKQFQQDGSLKNNIDTILKRCIDFNLTHYIDIPEDQLDPGNECEFPDPTPSIPEDQVELMRTVIDSFPMQEHVPPHWLVFMGISAEKVMKLRCAMFGKVPAFMRVLSLFTKEEYAIVYTFFSLVKNRTIYTEYPGYVHSYQQKLETAIRIFDLKQGDTFPIVAAATLACDNCKDIKHQVFCKKAVRKQTGRGSGKVMIDDWGRILCAKRLMIPEWQVIIKKPVPKKSVPLYKNTIHQTAAARMRKIAKVIAQQHELNRCKNTVVRQLRCFNGPISYDGVGYDCCHMCLQLMSYEDLFYIGSSLLCAACMKEDTTKTKNQTERCEYCTEPTNPDRRMEFFLFDDTVDLSKQDFRKMFFCKQHYPLNWIKEVGIMKKSQVMTGIINGWGTKNDKGELIQVGTITRGIYGDAM